MVVLIDGSVYFLTTNQAVEGSNPSSVTKSKPAQSLQRKLQALSWFARNSDKEGSFERSEKNPEVEQ
jgi:hypothetical protein